MRHYPDDYSNIERTLINKALIVAGLVAVVGLAILFWIYGIGA